MKPMEEENMSMTLRVPGSVVWGRNRIKNYTVEDEPIKDHRIFRAAVIAATRYFEEKS